MEIHCATVQNLILPMPAQWPGLHIIHATKQPSNFKQSLSGSMNHPPPSKIEVNKLVLQRQQITAQSCYHSASAPNPKC